MYEEQRHLLLKKLQKCSEENRVFIRLIRKNAINTLRKEYRLKKKSQDSLSIKLKELENYTNIYIKQINLSLKDKEVIIMNM